jgi:hypothetical protein
VHSHLIIRGKMKEVKVTTSLPGGSGGSGGGMRVT